GILLFVATGRLLAGPPAPTVALDPQESAWLREHPVIRIAPDPGFAPIEWFNHVGGYQGMTSDYLRLLEQRLGVQFEVVRTPDWNSVLDQVRRKQVDAITAVARTPQRESYLLFSQPHLTLEGAIIASQDLPPIRALADLKGYNVAVVEGDLWDDALTSLADKIAINRFHDLQTALTATASGVTDVTISTLDSARFAMRKEGLVDLKVVSRLRQKIDLHFGVRQDWPQLVRILNKGLASITPAERQAIQQKWRALGVPPRPWDSPVVHYTLLAGTGLLLILVTGVIVWNRTLKARVRARTRELENAQRQLIQAEKMESIGRLAAGVAHEVKNPLAIIQMGADFLAQELPADETTAGVINDIDDAVRRADTVVKGLLDFSRDRELELKPGNLNAIIERALHLVEHELRQRNIRVEQRLADGLPELDLDANRLQQVLINLFMNAAHAMKRDGKLLVRSRLRTLDSADLAADQANRFKPGEQVLWVEVADTGPGIREQDREKLFDPFYTTKPIGEGTGLGLSVSRNIISLHQGSLDIRNRKTGGASAVMMFKWNNGGKQ
ncbi:MAG TPA: transporter substrate-binding domain-containing protein, partial [Chromatiales bacterium]|nr:transporter substrate-binding domain-containing protein [Chromatiales bacterium]